ncbi:MAG: hypothetical protein ABSA39_17250 [Edaphobacter sp.]
MQTDLETAFRFDPSDPKSRQKLDRLIKDIGMSLPELFSDNFGQLLENLVWRKTALPIENDGGLALVVSLDLGEGDEVPLLTLRAGEINAFSHAELYASR